MVGSSHGAIEYTLLGCTVHAIYSSATISETTSHYFRDRTLPDVSCDRDPVVRLCISTRSCEVRINLVSLDFVC